MAHSSAQDNMNFEFFLNEKNYLNPELTTEDLKVFRRSEKQFKRMMDEILMLDEHIVQDKVYLAEYKLSPSTRAYYNKIKNSDFTLLTEEDATDSQQPVDANEIPKKILGLINKFHTDNKANLDVVSGDEKYRTILPQNIGKEPSILQKIVKGAQNLKGKSSNIAVKILTSILANSLEKIEKWYSTTKKNLIDAAKQGTLFSQIESQFLPSLKIAVRDPATGEITYTSDTEGPGLWNWLKAFVQRNPIWTNFIIGILINLIKIGATLYFGPLGGVVVGALFGIVLRSLVGRLKGESWGTAIKKAVIVTGMSILGGALTKGLFNVIKGGGFFSGFKSYFVGDAAQIAQDATAEKAGKTAVSGLKKLTTPQVEDLLKKSGGATALRNALEDDIAYSAKLTAAAEKLYPDTLGGPDRTIQYVFNLAEKGNVEELQDLLNAAGGLPQSMTGGVVTQAASDVAAAATSGLKKLSGSQLKDIVSKSGGVDDFIDQLNEKNPDLYEKLMAATAKAIPNQKNNPDYAFKWLLSMSRNPNSAETAARIINAAGGLPQSVTGGVATQAASDVTAAIAGKSVNEIGKAALNGQVDPSVYMQSYVDKFGGPAYRTLLKAFKAGIIKPDQFYSGTPIKFSAFLVGDNIPISINGVNVIGTLTKEEAASALAGYQMRQAMGNVIDVNILNQLAKQAGETISQSVKESAYKKMMKNLI